MAMDEYPGIICLKRSDDVQIKVTSEQLFWTQLFCGGLLIDLIHVNAGRVRDAAAEPSDLGEGWR